ncbi:hypothetical protein K3H46_19295 [Aeromonas veronii]|uniref:hypothetical protein n=1 Tax=Aeromonas veronii TaxID=654 RepID=UPI001F473064|nr:hypothetical protein [Aeromonas veronii]MCF5893152.1 hypothetical protein [Aeromonas veronii]
MSAINETTQSLTVSAASALSSSPLSIDLLSAILFFVIAALGSYVGSYLQRKGVNQADNENSKLILARLETTTEMTERIKQDIHLISNRKDRLWQQKREKLEDFVSCLTEIESYSRKIINTIIVRQEHGVFIEPNPINKLKMLQTLYFPEFENAVLSIHQILEETENLANTFSPIHRESMKPQFISLGHNLRGQVIALMLASAKIGKVLESEIDSQT